MTSEYGRDEIRPTRGLWITSFLSLLLSFGAGAFWSSHAWPLPYGARTSGIVENVQLWRLPIHAGYQPTVAYVVEGMSYHVTASAPSFMPLAPGDAVSIEYDPKRPDRAAVGYDADAAVSWLTVILVFAAGTLSFGFLRVGRRLAPEKEAVDLYPNRFSLAKKKQ